MARLSRLRLVNLGHELAHMDDLVLDFRDAAGQPTDSAVWLRNGGGKSSILNLFYAAVQPHRAKFLGATAEQKGRRLEDYVSRKSPGAVVAEWALDGGSEDLFGGGPERLLTGIFYEVRADARGEEGPVQRLFFSYRVVPNAAATEFDRVPLFGETPSGSPVRLTAVAFEAALKNLRRDLPHAEVFVANNTPGAWGEHLDGVGLDPEVFSYQIRMNAQEGGADRLFAFGEEQEFVNFFLDVMLDPAPSEQVARNVEQWRADLRRRADELLPERAMVGGLLERLTPLGDVRSRRETLAGTVAAEWRAVATAHRGVAAAIECARAAADAAERDAGEAQEGAAELERQATGARQRAAGLQRLVAEHEFDRADAALTEAQRRSEEAQRARRVWEVAEPLHRLQTAEAEARAHREALERKRQDLKPLLAQVEAAGTALVGALTVSAGRYDGEARRLRDHQADAQERGRDAQRRRSEASREVGICAQRAAGLEAQARTAQRELDLLRRDAGVRPDEAPLTALNRLDGEWRDAEASEVRAREAAGELRARERTVRGLLLASRSAHDLATRERSDTERALAAARREADALAESPSLVHLFGVERPTRDVLEPGLVVRLRAAAREQLDASIRLRVDRAVDERAIAALDATNLLPPRRDVERVREFLRAILPGVWSGWEYLSKNRPSDGVRAFIRRSPALADGVVVRDQDYAMACSHLEALAARGALTLEGPVLVAPQSGAGQLADGAHAPPGRVFGPTNDAAFDPAAGAAALEVRRAALEQIHGQLQRHDDARADFAALADRVEAFLERYSGGWLTQHEERLAALTRRVAEAAGRGVELEAEERELEEARGELEAELATWRDQRGRANTARQLVQAYLRQHPRGPAGYGEDAAAARAAGDAARETERNAHRDAELAQQQAEAYGRQAADQDGLARDERNKASAVRYRPAEGASADVAGDVAQLTASYRALEREYDGRLDAAAAQSLLERAEHDAADARRQLQRALQDAPVTEEDAERALASLSDASEVSDRRRRAAELSHQALSAVSTPSQVRTAAHARHQSAVEAAEAVRAPWPWPEPPASVEQAALDVAAAERDAAALAAERAEYETLANASRAAAQVHRGRERDLAHAQELLRQVAVTYTAPQSLVPGEIHEGGPRPDELTADAVRAVAANAARALRQADEAARGLDAERTRHTEAVRRWLNEPRFETLRSSVLASLRQWESAQYEAQFETLVRELELRRATIDGDVAAIDQHRTVLIDSAYSAATEGLRRLNQLEDQSKIPPTVHRIGGHAFLKVRTAEPKAVEERKARLAELIDDMVRLGSVPKGLAFTKLAVARLAGEVRVQVIFPDPDDRVRYVPIVDLAKFSGGERLTCATLLYCTLARLRARVRGRAEQQSGVLLYDNPIGKASRPKFLELQREVARQMGIQLIYFTGVDDLEAIRVLPNRIRLRNERRDRRSGHRLVELAETPDAAIAPAGQLSVARIVETEDHRAPRGAQGPTGMVGSDGPAVGQRGDG